MINIQITLLPVPAALLLTIIVLLWGWLHRRGK